MPGALVLVDEPVHTKAPPRVSRVTAFGHEVMHTDRRLRPLGQKLERLGEIERRVVNHEVVDTPCRDLGRGVDHSEGATAGEPGRPEAQERDCDQARHVCALARVVS